MDLEQAAERTAKRYRELVRARMIAAGQPPDPARTAAGQLAALAGTQVVAVQAAASITLAALFKHAPLSPWYEIMPSDFTRRVAH